MKMLLVVLLTLLATCCESQLIATTAEERTVIYNGVPRTESVLTFTASELANTATFMLGECVGTAVFNPPTYNYEYQTIGRVPYDLIPVSEEVCKVKDIGAYKQSLQATGNDLSYSINSDGEVVQLTDSATSSSTTRRLLQTGDSNSASYGAISSSSRYTAGSAGDPLTDYLYNSNQIDWNQQEEIDNLNLIARLSAGNFNLSIQNVKLLLQRAQNTDSFVQLFYYTWLASFNTTAEYLNALSTTLYQYIESEMQLDESVFTAIEGLIADRKADKAEFTAFANRDDMDAVQTTMMWAHIDDLPEDYVPWLWTEGVRPSPSNTLSFNDSRFLVDIVSFTQTVEYLGGLVVKYAVVQKKMYVYLNTDTALEWNGNELDFRILLSSLCSTDDCCEPPYCDAWITMDASACDNVLNTVQYEFLSGQKIDLLPTDCNPDPPPPNEPYFSLVSRTIITQADLIAEFGFSDPSASLDTIGQILASPGLCFSNLTSSDTRTTYPVLEFPTLVTSWRNQINDFLNATFDTCSLPLYGLRSQTTSAMASNGNITGPFFFFAGYVEAAYQLAVPDLARLRLLKYGRRPGSESFPVSTTIHTPTLYDNITGKVVPDGDSTPIECERVQWTAVSRQTLPVLLFQRHRQGFVDQTVTTTLTCPVCTGCTEVNEENITVSILSLTDFSSSTLPASFLQLGDVDSTTATTIYDLPASQLQVSPVLGARSGVSYLLFPADQLNSPTLDEFRTRMNGEGYTAQEATVSAQAFRVNRDVTPEGYPYCGIYGGEPNISPTLNNVTYVTNPCSSPFVWGVPMFQSTGCLMQQNASLVVPNVTQVVLSNSPTFGVSWFYQQESTNGDGGNVVVTQLNGGNNQSLIWYMIDGFVCFKVIYFDSSVTWFNWTFDGISDARDGYPHHFYWTFISIFQAQIYLRLYIDGQWQPGTNTNLVHFDPSYWGPTLTSVEPTGGPISEYAELDTIVVYQNTENTAMSPFNVYPLAHCQIAYRQIPQCINPSSSNLPILSTRVPLNRATLSGCGQLVPTVLYTNSLTSFIPILNGTNFLTERFMMTFWFSVSYVPMILNNEYIIIVSHGTLQLIVMGVRETNGVSLGISIGTASFNILIPSGDESNHMMAYVYDPNTSSMSLYIDGKLVNTASGIIPNTPQTGNGTIEVLPNNGILDVYNVLYFPLDSSYNPDNVWEEYNTCQNDQRLGPQVAACTAGSSNGGFTTTTTYCYSRLMCEGHCMKQSLLIGVEPLYTGLSTVCFPGWQFPYCLEPCLLINPATGQCVDDSNMTAEGFIAGGSQCDRLLNYRFAADDNTNLATYIPYHWKASIQLIIPLNGAFSSLIDTSTETCPSVDFARDNAGQLYLVISHDNRYQTQVIVSYGPFNDTTRNCTLPCCNAGGTLITIQPGRTFLFVVPACNYNTTQANVSLVTNPLYPQDNPRLCLSASGNGLQYRFQQAGTSVGNGGVYQFGVSEQRESQLAIRYRIMANQMIQDYIISAYGIVQKQRATLDYLAQQKRMWEQRLEDIRSGSFLDTIELYLNNSFLSLALNQTLRDNAIVDEQVQENLDEIFSNDELIIELADNNTEIREDTWARIEYQQSIIPAVADYLAKKGAEEGSCDGLSASQAFSNSFDNVLSGSFSKPGVTDLAGCAVKALFDKLTGSECGDSFWSNFSLSCLWEKIQSVLSIVLTVLAVALFLYCCGPSLVKAILNFRLPSSKRKRRRRSPTRSAKPYDTVSSNSNSDSEQTSNNNRIRVNTRPIPRRVREHVSEEDGEETN